jgi:hypothetical protein
VRIADSSAGVAGSANIFLSPDPPQNCAAKHKGMKPVYKIAGIQ